MLALARERRNEIIVAMPRIERLPFGSWEAGMDADFDSLVRPRAGDEAQQGPLAYQAGLEDTKKIIIDRKTGLDRGRAPTKQRPSAGLRRIVAAAKSAPAANQRSGSRLERSRSMPKRGNNVSTTRKIAGFYVHVLVEIRMRRP